MYFQSERSINNAFEENVALKQYVMATTIMTPKLITLLDMIQIKYQGDRVAEYASESRRKCNQYIHNKIKELSKDFDVGILRLAVNLYALYDDALIISCVSEKIIAWKAAYAIAERQCQHYAPLKISVSTIPMSKAEYCMLENAEISQELQDYVDEFKTWFELYFYEYDDYDTESETADAFNDALSILSNLQILAHVLTEDSNK